MLDEETRTAIFKLHEHGHGSRAIAPALKVARATVAPLHHAPAGYTAVLHHAPIAVLFTVLLASGGAQKHAGIALSACSRR
jgi:hypothetical protein